MIDLRLRSIIPTSKHSTQTNKHKSMVDRKTSPIVKGSTNSWKKSLSAELGRFTPTKSHIPSDAQLDVEFIEDRPIVERIEKYNSKDFVKKPQIHEHIFQDVIEVHETPVERKVVHPLKEVFVRDPVQYETKGKEEAERERTLTLDKLNIEEARINVQVNEHEDVTVREEKPIIQVEKKVKREIINRLIITEIHEQPIVEIHEQPVEKYVYEKPIVKVIREKKRVIDRVKPQDSALHNDPDLMEKMSSVQVEKRKKVKDEPSAVRLTDVFKKDTDTIPIHHTHTAHRNSKKRDSFEQ